LGGGGFNPPPVTNMSGMNAISNKKVVSQPFKPFDVKKKIGVGAGKPNLGGVIPANAYNNNDPYNNGGASNNIDDGNNNYQPRSAVGSALGGG